MTSSNPISEAASCRAYEAIKSNGWLAKQNFRVLTEIAKHANHPLTRNELYWELGGRGTHHNPEGTFGRRMNDLVKFGYIKVPYSRICTRSGKEDGVYVLTGYSGPPPEGAKKPSPTNIQKREAGEQLEALLQAESNAGRPVPETLRFICDWLKICGLPYEQRFPRPEIETSPEMHSTAS